MHHPTTTDTPTDALTGTDPGTDPGTGGRDVAGRIDAMRWTNRHRFFLGTHRPGWLWADDPVRHPLFVSHRTLRDVRRLRPATVDWALDSGGFTELTIHHGWKEPARVYVDAIRRYAGEIGRLTWCAPQDWMCEPEMLTRTGLSVADHQAATVASYLELRWATPEAPVIPVLQGWQADDYLHHIDLYERHGVDLFAEEVVGVGTMCRRTNVDGVAALFAELRDEGMVTHGFGLKADGIRRFGWALGSTDSLAWSAYARHQAHRNGVRMCGRNHPARSCSNCRTWAETWADRIVAIPTDRPPIQQQLTLTT